MLDPTFPLIHLARMIDAKEGALEKTRAPFVRRQLRADLDSLLQRFQDEYQLATAVGASPNEARSSIETPLMAETIDCA
jgi:hypothetical protein